MEQGQIYIIEAARRQDLARMFMRFQEYYESPEFKGKTFTVDEFAEWYRGQHGAFTYEMDWAGFNIPATVLEPFRQGSFDPLTKDEQRLLDLVRPASTGSYIIGVTPGAEYFDETVRHEFAHAAFYTSPNYRRDVQACVADHRTYNLEDGLADMGYHRSVAIDETNAYLLVEADSLAKYESSRTTQRLRERLEGIFKKNFGFGINEVSLESLMDQTSKILV